MKTASQNERNQSISREFVSRKNYARQNMSIFRVTLETASKTLKNKKCNSVLVTPKCVEMGVEFGRNPNDSRT